LDLLAYFHVFVDRVFGIISRNSQVLVSHTQFMGSFLKRRYGGQVVVRREVPEKRGRDANERAIRKLFFSPLHSLHSASGTNVVGGVSFSDLDCRLVHDNLMEPSLHEPTGDMFELLPSLDKQIAPGRRKSHRYAPATIASPDM
jgi:hypothetical protein